LLIRCSTMVVAITCFVVAFCSAVITAGTVGPEKDFHVSREVSFLPITVFVVGFGIGMYGCCLKSSITDIFKVPWFSPLCQRSWADESSMLRHS
jgi:hypothetical protein